MKKSHTCQSQLPRAMPFCTSTQDPCPWYCLFSKVSFLLYFFVNKDMDIPSGTFALWKNSSLPGKVPRHPGATLLCSGLSVSQHSLLPLKAHRVSGLFCCFCLKMLGITQPLGNIPRLLELTEDDIEAIHSAVHIGRGQGGHCSLPSVSPGPLELLHVQSRMSQGPYL